MSSSFTVKAANFTLRGGQLRAMGDTDESGGDIFVQLTGTLTTTGDGTRIDAGGNGGGGTVGIVAAAIDVATGVIAADGGSGETCGAGGNVNLTADGSLVVRGVIHALTGGHDCDGGSITLTGGSVSVWGDLDARGGAAASDEAVTITATSGDVRVEPSAFINVDGYGTDADAGQVVIFADGGRVFLWASSVRAVGKPPAGSGGGVSIVAAQDVDVTSRIVAYGGDEGAGGDFDIQTDGNASVANEVLVSGGSSLSNGKGGLVQLQVAGDLVITDDLDASGAAGGQIAITGRNGGLPETLSLTGSLLARGNRASGGIIDVGSCALTVSGTVDVGSSNGGAAGTIALAGEQLTVSSSGRVRALPCPQGSCIGMRTRSGTVTIDGGAIIDPAPVIAADPAIPPC